MTIHDAEGTQPSESEDEDGEQLAYELADYGRPPGDSDDNDSDVAAEEQPAYELIDHAPPPPDDQVIARQEARLHGIQRSWLLGTFIAVFVVVIFSDIGLSAFLPPRPWGQLKPEIDGLRSSLFTILLVIIGYYFGGRRKR